MSYEVRNISDVDKTNIKLGKTFKYYLGNDSSYNLTNIYYINTNNTPTSTSTHHTSIPTPTNTTNISSYIPKENESKRQDSFDEKTKLIFQTPLMYVPKKIIHFNEKPFIELSFNNEENDKDVLEFKNWINNLENYIYKLIKKRKTLNIEKCNLCSILKNNNNNSNNNNKNNNSSHMIVPLNINISKCILNEDYNNSKKNKILFNWDIPVPTYAISIIWVKNVWVKNEKWGINLFMYTSRVMNSHILDPIEFMDLDNTYYNNKNIKTQDITKYYKEDKNASIQIGQIPEYILYFKMLKMGIPKDAVKQKIVIAGLESRYIDYPDTTPYITVLHYISNPHLGPYVNTNTNTISNTISNNSKNENKIENENNSRNNNILNIKPNIKLNLLNNIKSGEIKLKKVNLDKNTTKDKIISGLIKTSSNVLKVPSLGDIQNALSNLKKITIESHSNI